MMHKPTARRRGPSKPPRAAGMVVGVGIGICLLVAVGLVAMWGATELLLRIDHNLTLLRGE